MAITKKPKSNLNTIAKQSDEEAAEAFILGAGQASKAKSGEAKKVPIMMRFDPDVLQRVDTAAKRRGISRSAWIQFTVSRALDQGEG
jgi:uncharacterized protein (DUF4415 family)